MDIYLRPCLDLECLWKGSLQDHFPTHWMVWDLAHPSSGFLGCFSSSPPSPGCCFEDWVFGLIHPSWILGLECSGPVYLILHSLPRYCCCRCWRWFGLARSNTLNQTGHCHCPSPLSLYLFGAPPSGCWPPIGQHLHHYPTLPFHFQYWNPSPAVV